MARIGFKIAKYNKIVDNSYAPLTSSKVPVFKAGKALREEIK